MDKERLDILLVKKGLFASREKAKAAIMAGIIRVNGQKVDKAGTLVDVDAALSKTGEEMPYVSRGGLKLEKALKTFSINLNGKVILDVGASTGGFTHCALLNGARKVFAVDVGYGQLAWQLRQDERVVLLERVNVRYLKPEQLAEKADVATIDVSFISVAKVLPAVLACLKSDGEIVALIKPQFEAGKEKVGKKGVVKDPAVHREVIATVVSQAEKLELYMSGLTYSPITGPEGNIEYLLWLTCKHNVQLSPETLIRAVVAEAHQQLKA
ncbi:TlyA family RNA methyltransferase [Zhaonella formicivorans]|uniref:TlyA family RNA methyltransferase n=1 Tax=Zhaonella formicivorans TaxID=2528593 RepID=UPI0010EB5501|nr:TlyA family RNA methyltransferase [Zhaonella formicivorans]